MNKIGIAVASAAALGLGAWAQVANNLPKPSVKIEVVDGYRIITANGIPDHPTGAFPNRGNPNRIAEQQHRFRVPLKPTISTQRSRGVDFGVAVNGIPFDPGTAELWNNDFQWHYEALSGVFGKSNRLGVDRNLAHVQPDGTYHYHGLPIGLLERLGADKRMVLVGWAADGYPVYGNIGPTDPSKPNSPLRTIRSSYRLKTGDRPTGNGPQGAYDGSFSQDFEYVAGSGDLDEHNGRTGPTPEFPNGTYYYVLTESYPFIPRSFRGTPDPSFRKAPPSGLRQRGAGAQTQATPPPQSAANRRYWFVIRDGALHQYDLQTGKWIAKTPLPAAEPR
jgi:hypothetical protein